MPPAPTVLARWRGGVVKQTVVEDSTTDALFITKSRQNATGQSVGQRSSRLLGTDGRGQCKFGEGYVLKYECMNPFA